MKDGDKAPNREGFYVGEIQKAVQELKHLERVLADAQRAAKEIPRVRKMRDDLCRITLLAFGRDRGRALIAEAGAPEPVSVDPATGEVTAGPVPVGAAPAAAVIQPGEAKPPAVQQPGGTSDSVQKGMAARMLVGSCAGRENGRITRIGPANRRSVRVRIKGYDAKGVWTTDTSMAELGKAWEVTGPVGGKKAAAQEARAGGRKAAMKGRAAAAPVIPDAELRKLLGRQAKVLVGKYAGNVGKFCAVQKGKGVLFIRGRDANGAEWMTTLRVTKAGVAYELLPEGAGEKAPARRPKTNVSGSRRKAWGKHPDPKAVLALKGQDVRMLTGMYAGRKGGSVRCVKINRSGFAVAFVAGRDERGKWRSSVSVGQKGQTWDVESAVGGKG